MTETPPEKKRFRETALFTVLVSTGAGILVAAAASLTTIETTNASNQKDRDLQQQNFENQRREEARVKREQVYKAYLDAANEYSVATNHLFDVCSPQPRVTLESLAKICSNYSEFNSARANYQVRLNDMFLFGTPEALLATISIIQALPPGQSSRFPTVTLARPNDANFSRAYNLLQTQTCVDVRIDLNQPCI